MANVEPPSPAHVPPVIDLLETLIAVYKTLVVHQAEFSMPDDLMERLDDGVHVLSRLHVGKKWPAPVVSATYKVGQDLLNTLDRCEATKKKLAPPKLEALGATLADLVERTPCSISFEYVTKTKENQRLIC